MRLSRQWVPTPQPRRRRRPRRRGPGTPGRRLSGAARRWAWTRLRSTSAAPTACPSAAWAWRWARTRTSSARCGQQGGRGQGRGGRVEFAAGWECVRGGPPPAAQLFHTHPAPTHHGETQVCQWANAVATKPVWAKMTPNITDITVPAKAALDAGEGGARCERLLRNPAAQRGSAAHACSNAHASHRATKQAARAWPPSTPSRASWASTWTLCARVGAVLRRAELLAEPVRCTARHMDQRPETPLKWRAAPR